MGRYKKLHISDVWNMQDGTQTSLYRIHQCNCLSSFPPVSRPHYLLIVSRPYLYASDNKY